MDSQKFQVGGRVAEKTKRIHVIDYAFLKPTSSDIDRNRGDRRRRSIGGVNEVISRKTVHLQGGRKGSVRVRRGRCAHAEYPIQAFVVPHVHDGIVREL